MQNKKHHIYIRLLLLFIATISVGCTTESLSPCSPYSHVFIVSAFNSDGVDITENGDIKEINAYIFDAQEEFIAIHKAELGKDIELNYPDNDKLHVVILGNSASDKQIAPKLEIGDKLETSYISLITDTKSTHQVASTPDDLFKGRKETIRGDVITPVKIDIRRKVASVVITAKGVKEYANTTSGDFHYILRYGKSQINFMGLTSGDDVIHKPEAKFNSGLLESSIFNILPPVDGNIEIDIYNGSNLIYTIEHDDNGNPLEKVKEGELLNIYVSLIGDVSVSVEITPWGEKKIWKEF